MAKKSSKSAKSAPKSIQNAQKSNPKTVGPLSNSSSKAKKSAKSAPKSTQNVLKTPKKLLESTKPTESAPRAPKKSLPVWALLTALILVVGGGILFMFSLSGWFDSKTVTLEPEYYASTSASENTENTRNTGNTENSENSENFRNSENSDGDFVELLTVDRYNELVDNQKSFLLFVDQTNCVVANRLRDYIKQYTSETGVKPLRIMFSDLKNTPLHEQIKYYPSVVIISNGQPVKYLDPSADADAEEFNDYTAFKTWLNETIVIK